MDTTFAYLGSFFLSIIILLFGAEVFGYIVNDYKMKEIKEDAIELIQNKGGYTDEVEAKVEQWIKDNNLDAYGVEVTVHPAATLQWQESFDFRMEGKYWYRTLNILGTGLGNFAFTLASYGSGASQVFPHS